MNETKRVARRIVEELTKRQKTIAIAESLTGGMLASSIVDISGASNVLKGSITAYMLEIKESVLNVPLAYTKETDGVDPRTAELMARNVAELMEADYGISTTGIAESWDERPEQAYICFYDRKRDTVHLAHIEYSEEKHNREEVRESVTLNALEWTLNGVRGVL